MSEQALRNYRRRPLCPKQSALTLVELLVVLVIITLVTAAAIPMMAPQGDSRRQREAARMVASFLQGARSRAIETGRPVGVVFDWFPPGSQSAQPFSMNLSYGTASPPYGGDMVNAVAQFTPPTFDDAARRIQFRLNMQPYSSFNTSLVHKNDQIRFNYQGYSWPISGPDTDNNGVVDSQPADPQFLDVLVIVPTVDEYIARKAIVQAMAAQPVPMFPYQVFRQPVRSASGPVQLPEGAVIDIPLCGFGEPTPTGMPSGVAGRFNLPNNPWPGNQIPRDPTTLPMPAPLTITFAPNGTVERVYNNPNGTVFSSPPTRVTAPLYLMIGKREKVRTLVQAGPGVPIADYPNTKYSDPAATLEQRKRDHNFTDPDNFWVVVNPSGTIVTGEVVQPTTISGDFDTDFPQTRNIARTGENVGGR